MIYENMNSKIEPTVPEGQGMKMRHLVQYGDQNAGVEREFDSFEEALDWAEYKWDRLTPSERQAYSSNGGYFLVQTVDAETE